MWCEIRRHTSRRLYRGYSGYQQVGRKEAIIPSTTNSVLQEHRLTVFENS